MATIPDYVSIRSVPYVTGEQYKYTACKQKVVSGSSVGLRQKRVFRMLPVVYESPSYPVVASDGTSYIVLRPSYDEVIKLSMSSVDVGRLKNNLSRLRSRCLEYGLCNTWDWFATLTVSSDRPRDDLKAIKSQLSKWLDNYKQRSCPSLRYMLIPEFHDKGGVHFHGFFSGLDISCLDRYEVGKPMSKSIARMVRSGRCLYRWVPYDSAFGFNSFEAVQNGEAAARYMIKYITKDLIDVGSGLQLLLVSKGLNRSEVVFKGSGGELYEEIMASDAWENDFCKVQYRTYDDDFFDVPLSAAD